MSICLHPKIIRNPVFGLDYGKTGKKVARLISEQPVLVVPCGHCINCLSVRQNTWAWRIEQDVFDAFKKDGCAFFVTMTYDDEHLVYGFDRPTLVKKDVQEYHKKMWNLGFKYRYFTCGEYGDRFSRPHYHEILIFDTWMSKQDAHDMLFPLWNKCEDYEFRVDDFSLASAKYVAKYCMKRFGVDYDGVQTPFSMMSLKPCIGSSFLHNRQEIQRLKDMKSVTVYDSSGVANVLPRVFREKIFEPDELQSIYQELEREEHLMDVLRCGTDDFFSITDNRHVRDMVARENEKMYVNQRFLDDIGKDCRISYSDYLLSL